jgi:hypothetical protein
MVIFLTSIKFGERFVEYVPISDIIFIQGAAVQQAGVMHDKGGIVAQSQHSALDMCCAFTQLINIDINNIH